MTDRLSFRDRVAAFLRANEGRWISAVEFESIGGRQAWRTRIAECRTKLGMDIENDIEVVKKPDGSRYTLSRYRYVSARGQVELFR